MRYMDRRTFPILAYVGKDCGFAQKILLNLIHKRREGNYETDVFPRFLPAVGYFHFSFHDQLDETNGTRNLIINVGISLCNPDEHSKFDASIGKELAHQYADNLIPCTFVCGGWKKDDKYGLMEPCTEGYSTLPFVQTLLHTFHLRRELGGIFDKVEIILNSGLRVKRLMNTFIRGSETDTVYVFERTILDQLRPSLFHAITGYLRKRFRSKYEIKDVDCDILPRNFLRIKNHTKIIPMKTEVSYTDFSTIPVKYKDTFRNYEYYDHLGRHTVGYLALCIEDGKFYTGVSYCHPEDFFTKKNRYGRRLAFKRLMERKEKGLDGADELTKKLCEKKSLDVQHVTEKGILSYGNFDDFIHTVHSELLQRDFLHGVTNLHDFTRDLMISLGFWNEDMFKEEPTVNGEDAVEVKEEDHA